MAEQRTKPGADAAKPDKKRRTLVRRIVRIFLALFALAAGLAVAAGLILIHRPEMLGLGETLAARVSEATGLDCRAAGPIEMGVFPAPYVQIYRISLFAPEPARTAGASSPPPLPVSAANATLPGPVAAAVNATIPANATLAANAAIPADPAPETAARPEPLLSLSAVRVELSPLPLLWGEVELRRLKLFDPVLDLDALRAMTATAKPATAEPAAQAAPPQPAPANATQGPPAAIAAGSANAANATALVVPDAFADLPDHQPETAQAYDEADLALLLDMLLHLEISGGAVFERDAQGNRVVLAGGVNLDSGRDGLALSLRSHALASPQDSASLLEVRLRDLAVDNGRIKAAASVAAVLNTLGQSLRPEISGVLVYDPAGQSLEITDFALAMEKLRIKGQLTAAFPTGGGFQVSGHLEHEHLSLPRWFQFGRNLPGSLQYALDDLSGTMDFDLNQDRLVVSHMDANVLGMVLTGTGGTPDFGAPDVVIDAGAPFLDVNLLFPEVTDPPPDNPPRVHYDDPPLVGGAEVDDSDLPDVGHDIIIRGETAEVRQLKVDGLSVRIVPSPRGTQCKFTLGAVAGGKLNADLTVLSGGDKIEIDADLDNLSVQTLGEDLFGRGPLVAEVGGKAKITANPDTLDIFFRSMDLDFALKFGAGSLFLRETNRKLAFNSVTASGQGSSAPGQDGSDSMLTFVGNWNFQAVSGKEKLRGTLHGPVSVDERTLDLAVHGGDLNAAANAELGFLGLNSGHEVKFTGRFDYDDRARTLNLRKASIALPYGAAVGDIACKEQGFPGEAWSGSMVLTLPSVLNWLEYMGFDKGDMPEHGLNNGVFDFKFEQSGQKWAIKDVDLVMDDKTKGRLNLSQAADNSYAFSLNLDFIDMDQYYPSRKTSSALPAPHPWDLNRLIKMRAKGDIVIKDMAWRKLHYTNVTSRVTLENGRLRIPTTAEFYGGQNRADLDATLEPNRLNARFSLEFKGAQLGGITRDLYADERASGPINVSLQASGAPTRSSEVLTAFDGQWAFDVGKGYFRGKRDANTGKEPEKTEFSAIRASGRLHDGRLETDNFMLSAPGSTVTTGRGQVDIARDTIDMDFEVRMLGIDVPVRLTGPLDAPETKVKSGKLIGNAVGGIGSGLFGLVVDVITLPGKVIMLPFGGGKNNSGKNDSGKNGGGESGTSSSGGGNGAGGSSSSVGSGNASPWSDSGVKR